MTDLSAGPKPASKTPKTASPANYEELDGGQGRAVFYRPERYNADDLAMLAPAVAVTTEDGQTFECRLHNLSQNGLAFEPPAGHAFVTGQSVPTLVVSFSGLEAYRGAAQIVEVRANGTTTVGATFVGSLLDIDDVLHLRTVRTWQSDGGPGVRLAGHPWHVEGHDGFKSLVAEMRLFLQDAQAEYGRMEAALPWHVVQGDIDSPPRSALQARVSAEFVPDYLRITERLDLAVRQAGEAEWKRLKEFSVRNLHELLMHAPLLYRTHLKPLGYPGDYVSMDYMYSRHFEGQTLFGKAVHMGSCQSMPARAVRARMALIRERIREAAAGWREARPLRICSIAAGPCQEVLEFLTDAQEVGGPVEIILFEQDKMALTFAHRRLGPAAERWKGRVKLVLLQDSIKRLLFDPGIFRDLGPFDMIFAAGLFDYLKFPTAVGLTRNLHANLAPGGACYIGNMDGSNPGRWMFEHHLDWFLIYRTTAEMLEFGRTAVPDAPMEIVKDATGINPFLVVRKS